MILDVRDLGVMNYGAALELQESLVELRKRGEIPDTLLLIEHPPVYTLGRAAAESNITADPAELRRLGIEVVRTSRGGEVTYHGPGQLVGYPIIDLGAHDGSAVWYVDRLERVMIEALAGFGVTGTTDRQNRGVWVGDDKVGAIGVRITRHITMHGFSLNVCPDLNDYRGIVPCGIRDKGVTALNLLAPDVGMGDVKTMIVEKFTSVFGYTEKRLVSN